MQNVTAITYPVSVFPKLIDEGSKAHYFSISRVQSAKGLKEKMGAWGDLFFCLVWLSPSLLSFTCFLRYSLSMVAAYTCYWNWPTKVMLRPLEMPTQLPRPTKEVRIQTGTWLTTRLFECHPMCWGSPPTSPPPKSRDYTFSSFGVALRPKLITKWVREWATENCEQCRSFYFWITFVKNRSVLFGSCFQAAFKSDLNTDQEVHISMAVLNNNL